MYRYNAQTICLNNYESYDAEKKVKKELKSIVREYSEQPYECDPSYLNMVDKRGCQKEIEEEFCPARFYLDINQGSIITEIKVTQFVVFENVFPQKIPIPSSVNDTARIFSSTL